MYQIYSVLGASSMVDYSGESRTSLRPLKRLPMEYEKSTAESPDALFARANKEWDAGNAKLAYRLFLQAATAGHASAKNSVGYFLDQGLGVRKNAAQALLWYRRAARHGDLGAYSNVAISYRNAGNAKQATAWFQKAAEKGDAGASIDLAELLLEANIKGNLAKAVRLLRAAIRSRYVSDDERDRAARMLEKLED
jgi:TPR repeat protein